MRIDKVQPFYTDEDRAALEDLDTRLEAMNKEFEKLREDAGNATSAGNQQSVYLFFKNTGELFEERAQLIEKVERRYFESFHGDTLAILEDAQEIIAAITKEDYLQAHRRRVEELKPVIERPPAKGATKEERQAYKRTKALTVRGFETCYSFILSLVRVQLEALNNYGDEANINRVLTIVEATAESFYSKPRNWESKAGQAPKDAPRQTVESIIPKYYIMPNTRIINALTGGGKRFLINDGANDIPVIPAKNKQPEVTTYFMITDPRTPDKKSNLSNYEREVSNSIFSIFEEAKRNEKAAVFTVDMVYRGMIGGGERPSKQQKAQIEATINKLIHFYQEIDATEELRKRGAIADGDTWHIKDYYLRAQEHIYKAKGGQPVRAWVLRDEPLQLSYAKLTGQFISAPARCLHIEKVDSLGRLSGQIVSMSEDRVAMAGYLLRRVAVMKHDTAQAMDALRAYNKRREKNQSLENKTLADFRRQSDTILFSTVFSESLLCTTSSEAEEPQQQRQGARTTAQRNREFCFDVLKYWKSIGYIKDFSPHGKGRSITGVKIET